VLKSKQPLVQHFVMIDEIVTISRYLAKLYRFHITCFVLIKMSIFFTSKLQHYFWPRPARKLDSLRMFTNIMFVFIILF